MGHSVLISVEFPKLPPKCAVCGEFGHLRLRCPGPTVVKVPNVGAISSSSQLPPVEITPQAPVAGKTSRKIFSSDPPNKLSRSLSLPHIPAASESKEDSDISSTHGWTRVIHRSKPPKGTSASGSGPSKKKTSSAPLLNSHFAAEEEVIQKAQAILRNRLSALESKPPEGSTSGSRKHARRRLRQKIYLLTSSSSENHVDS
ncbi:unnamed protein product, partial [Brassica rapa]